MRKIFLSFILMLVFNSTSYSSGNFDRVVSKNIKNDFEKAWKENEVLDEFGFNKKTFAEYMGEVYKNINTNFFPKPSYDQMFDLSLKALKNFVPDLVLDRTKSRMLIYKGYDLIGTFPLPDNLSEEDISLAYGKIFSTAVLYGKRYSEELKKASNEELAHVVVNFILKSLDSNSSYLYHGDTENAASLRDKNFKNTMYSFGFYYRMVSDGIQIVNISMNPNMIAQGMSVGDLIVSINDIPLAGVSQEVVEEFLSINNMKTYKVNYYSYLTKEKKEVYITNYKLKLNLLQSDFSDGILTVYFNSFVDGVADDFYEILNPYLSNDDFKGLVVDLRGSVFGKKDEVLKMIDMFSKDGVVAVFETAKNGRIEIVENDTITDKNLIMGDIPFVILIDRSVTGIAEMFAQSMQVGVKAFVVGEASYGEGRVYNEFELSDKSIINVPNSSFYSYDKVLNKIGVLPLVCSYDIVTEEDIEKLFSAIRSRLYTPYSGDIWFSKEDDLAVNKAEALRKGCPYKKVASYELDTILAKQIAADVEIYDYLMGVMLDKFKVSD